MSFLSAELSATCNALGYFDKKTNKYYADANTLETVKDLIRYLRRDDDTHEIRRSLGETKVVQTDLLPLLKCYWEENDLFDVILRLVVNLTTPALILWNEEIPTDKTVRNYYLQIEDHLQSYKEAFADERVWAVLSTRLSKILEDDYAARGDENSLIIERILILIRNILYVPADTMEKRPDNDASIHDQVLWALHQSGMLDIILYITSSSNEQAYYMHIIEILSFMLREQNATELAHAALQRSETEKIRDEAELLAVRHREINQKQQKIRKYTGARHSRFGGTFVVTSMKSISDNELIYHKPLNKLDSLNFDGDKVKPKTPRNRAPMISNTSERRSAFTIRLFLKEFCVEFLNGAYNTLMYYVKDNLVRAKAQSHDESYYLWALRFFMEFNRSYKFEVKLVSETMSIQTFHYVQQLSENYFDLMSTDKKKLRLWSKRLHLALLAYCELFHTLLFMDKSPDETVRDSAKVIKSNIFYVPEYREFVLTLLVNYNELKMSDVYLKDLMETQHIFIKMFENFCGGKEGSVLVQRKKKSRSQKKKTQTTQRSQPATSQVLDLEGKWDEASQQLSVVLDSGGEFLADVPFDAASDIPIDEQKSEAMIKIQRKLRNFEFESAIGLLRVAREVWPENDSFGSQNMSPEEEFLALKDIFFANLGENDMNLQSQPEHTSVNNDSYEDEDEEEHERYAEVDFNFTDFIERLPHPKIVRACGLALANFETNSVTTNHCIVKLLHRIAFDCKKYIMIFQLSIFRSFQKIFDLKDMPQYKELVKFATYIMRQFFKTQETNKKIFVEALFWKSKRDALDIEHNYENFNENASTGRWTEEQEDELRRLFMEHQNNNIQVDVVDWIIENLIDNTRSRRVVLRKLKDMSLIIDDYKRKKSGARPRAQQTWGAEEESQLTELYEEFKDAPDPMDCIMSRLEFKRPKNRIIEKMLVMGLIQDKKELRKKRIKKSNTINRKTRTSRLDHESNSESTSDSDDGRHNTSTKTSNLKQRKLIQRNTPKTAVMPKNKRQKKKTVSPAPEREQLTKYLLHNINAGRQEALEWLKESFSDAIEDFEEDDGEGIPLVPIMDYSVLAMESEDFQSLLKTLGICEPCDEQESYWRMPSSLTPDVLRGYCTIIQEALDGTLANSSAKVSNIRYDESSDDENIFDRLRNITKESLVSTSAKSLAEVPTGRNQESSEDENIFDRLRNVTKQSCVDHQKETNTQCISGTSAATTSMEEVENMVSNSNALVSKDNHVNGELDVEDTNRNLGKTRIRKVIDSDSDEEHDKENTNRINTEVGEEGSKRSRRISDSDSDKPTSKKSRIIDSDED